MKRMFTKQFVCCLLLILYMVLLCQTAIADMLTVTDGQHICNNRTKRKHVARINNRDLLN